MGIIERVKRLCSRGKELRAEVVELRSEVASLRAQVGDLSNRLEAINAQSAKNITAKQILNEYLYGENGDE